MRVVLDTNVIASALLWGGVPERLIELAGEGVLELSTSEALLAELAGILDRPKFAQKLRLSTGEAVFEYNPSYVRTVPSFQCASRGVGSQGGHLVGLKMPRALEALDATLHRLEQGETSVLDALETLLTGVAATPHSATTRRFSSCRTGSRVSTSRRSRPNATALEGEKPRERQFSARGAALRQRTQVAAHDGVRAERASADAGPRPVTDLFFQDRTVDSTESMLTFSSVLLFTEI